MYIPYIPLCSTLIPSASGFGGGFGRLNSFSQGIRSTRDLQPACHVTPRIFTKKMDAEMLSCFFSQTCGSFWIPPLFRTCYVWDIHSNCPPARPNLRNTFGRTCGGRPPGTKRMEISMFAEMKFETTTIPKTDIDLQIDLCKRIILLETTIFTCYISFR